MSGVRLGIQPTIEEDVELIDSVLGAYTQIQAHSVLCDVQMGDFSYCAGYNQIYYAQIGKFCSIASFARINPGNHPTYTRVAQHHFSYRSAQFGFGEDDADFFAWRRAGTVSIGNDVWIGHGAIILPGVSIGNGAVVGAGTVVTKDVEPYAVVAGAPARKMKMRFSDALIEKIEQSKWWDWHYDVIKERLADFRDLDAFVQKYL
ncbi:MAG TPA: DapH/DapD/GlmU-related protein [Pseudoflavonifractor sp.]|nr:DapH/DapD/GlmU-related protein [Pseudoflavonifractor sp.]